MATHRRAAFWVVLMLDGFRYRTRNIREGGGGGRKLAARQVPEKRYRTVVYVRSRPVGLSMTLRQYPSGRTNTPFT